MKVYYNMGIYEGCNYVRCLLPLINNGWDGDYTSLLGKRVSEKQILNGMLDADIIVMQRPFEKARKDVFNALKQAGKKIVVDNDDTYKVNVGQLEKLRKEVSDSMDWFYANADLVTTTTQFLADEYSKLNKNVVVLPNCVDPDDFPKPIKNKGKKVRLGLIGSVVGTNDFDHIVPLLKELSELPNVEIVVMSTKPNDGNFFDTIKVEWHEPVKVAQYFDKINELKLDIMLIPRKEGYFNKCKSNLKFLEASMFEIPCITDDWKDNPYTKDADYLVMTHNWSKDLYDLINDKEARKLIGKRAKKYVLKNYNIKDKAVNWENAYKELIK